MNSDNSKKSEAQVDDFLEVIEILEQIEVNDETLEANGFGYSVLDSQLVAF